MSQYARRCFCVTSIHPHFFSVMLKTCRGTVMSQYARCFVLHVVQFIHIIFSVKLEHCQGTVL